MIISAAISIGLPVALFFIWRNKYNTKLVPLVVGVVTYLLFKGLEQMMHLFVFEAAEGRVLTLMQANPALFIIYGILAIGIFEESGRFLAFQILKSRYNGPGTGLSYGLGHGGVESVMITGLAMIGSIMTAVMINNGNISLLGDDPALIAELGEFAKQSPISFIFPGIARIITITIHISLSVFVWCSVKVQGKLWLYPTAIILHAILNIPSALYQINLITNIQLVETLMLIPATLIALAAYKLCKSMKTTEETETPTETIDSSL